MGKSCGHTGEIMGKSWGKQQLFQLGIGQTWSNHLGHPKILWLRAGYDHHEFWVRIDDFSQPETYLAQISIGA